MGRRGRNDSVARTPQELLTGATAEVEKIRIASGLLFSRSNTLRASPAASEITYLAQRLGDHAQAALEALRSLQPDAPASSQRRAKRWA